MGIDSERSFLTTLEVDVMVSAGDHSIDTVMDVLSEDLSKIATEKKELGVLTGMIMMILQSACLKGAKDNKMVLLRTGRVIMNWPDMMVRNGKLSYTFAGLQTISDVSVRYRFSFRGDPTNGRSDKIHTFLGYEKLESLRDALKLNNIFYSKETGLWTIG